MLLPDEFALVQAVVNMIMGLMTLVLGIQLAYLYRRTLWISMASVSFGITFAVNRFDLAAFLYIAENYQGYQETPGALVLNFIAILAIGIVNGGLYLSLRRKHTVGPNVGRFED